MATGRLVVGVTGASGSIYAQRFLAQAVRHFDEVNLILSAQALQVAEIETGIRLDETLESVGRWMGVEPRGVRVLDKRNYFTPPASGSYQHDGMVIVPCSMGTAGRIAAGVSDDLMTRSADVCLKEKRPLVLVPRETPWNLVHLRNFTALAEAGATVLPACPGWYGRPQNLEELADTIVARILQMLGTRQNLVQEWMAEDAPDRS